MPWGLAVGSGQQDPKAGDVGKACPHLLARHHPFVTVEHGNGGERSEIRPGLGLAEKLTPNLRTGEERPKPTLFLSFCARTEQGRTCPPDADRVDRATDAGPLELFVDDELHDRIGVEPTGLDRKSTR